MDFTAILELHGKTATGIEVPDDVVAALGGGKRPPVTVTINGFSYRSTVAPYNGVNLLPVSAEVREGAGIAAGETVTVGLVLDSAKREVAVPKDLAVALRANPAASEFFASLSFSNQRGYVDWIEQAKKAETRTDRVAKTIESLTAGRKTR
jgi:Bacteriocin-protection, YdeI or OmpD-Associated/Domain of unknown function (DUF1905)